MIRRQLIHASIEMHWRDRETCLRNAQRQVVGRLVREVPRHITALRRAGRTHGPPTVTQTSRPTLPRVRTLCTRASLSVGQHCGSNSHPPFPDLSRTYSELVPVATATSDRCTSKCARAPAPPGPQCACSPVLPLLTPPSGSPDVLSVSPAASRLLLPRLRHGSAPRMSSASGRGCCYVA